MEAVIFDGKKKAEEILVRVRDRVRKLGFAPKLISFYLPEDEGSVLYTKIKSKKAKEVGIEFEGVPIQKVEETVQLIKQASDDPAVHGILVQHPQGGVYSNEQWQKLILAIAKEKDVDGLRDDSRFLPATVKAILYVLEEARVQLNEVKIVVVGSEGMIGKRLVIALSNRGAEVIGIDLPSNLVTQLPSYPIIISATGVPGIIKGNMVKEGAIVIDVGSPKGDVDFEEVLQKASFITPVPGGVGPMTVACLLENVVESVQYSHPT